MSSGKRDPSDESFLAKLWRLQTTVNELVLDCKRDPERVCKALQEIVDVPDGSVQVTEPSLDTIVRVDRSVRPVYPDWAKVVMHPELEAVGPAEYDLAEVELYLHHEQKNGSWMKGTKLYEHLKEIDSLKNCLGLHDALAIQRQGIKVFRKVFGGKAVFCWKSVVRHPDGNLHVPYVGTGGGSVVVSWYWLDYDWHVSHPAARFAS